MALDTRTGTHAWSSPGATQQFFGLGEDVNTLLPLTIVGIVSGCIYAISATGLVVTYTTTGIFNFAHGAVGMVAAFAFWQLSVHWHLGEPLAFLIVLFVIAPLMGAIVERVLMRPIRGATLDVTLTTTLGLLLFGIGLATVVWDPKKPRLLSQFFRGNSVKLFGVVVTAHQITVVVAAVLVAIVLRLFLYRSRPGTALRAVVDNPELTGLTGASPARYGQLGWVIGAVLAALAGMLLAPLITLDIQTLTLLVINGYAAAMVGRMRNIPLTFAGGLGLGLLESYLVGYLPVGTWLSTVKPALPMAFLFLILIVLPEQRIETKTSSLRSPRVARLWESVIAGAALVVIAVIVAPRLSAANLVTASHGVALGLIMLSLVLLVGYGGQVSLCQMTFAGLGAFAMGKVAGGHSWWGILAAIGLSAAVGALVALPALRLRGLYLALATLAFASAMDVAFFSQHDFGTIGRVSLLGTSLHSNTRYLVFLCALFALMSIGLLALRRAPFGRRLTAMADSPAASATLGMNLVATKLIVFAASAGLAGFAGALYAGQQGLVGAADFQLLLSLTLLLLAVVYGVRTTTGMLFAGLTFAIIPVLQSHIPALRDLLYLATGLAAIAIVRNPNGAFGGHSPLQARRDKKAAAAAKTGVAQAAADVSVDSKVEVA
jgi:branched-chain amino acid transport system permease protein